MAEVIDDLKGTELFYLVLIFLLCVISPLRADTADPNDQSLLTIKRIFTDDEFKTESFGPARWLDDNTGFTTIGNPFSDEDANDIVLFEPQTQECSVLISQEQLTPAGSDRPLVIDDYSWSKDGRKLLIFTNTARVWRSNTRGDYLLYELETGRLRKLGGDAEESMLMFAKFSPDGKYVGYVYKNNIYVQNLKNFRIKKLTKDGSDVIVNGTSDWVYEEEFSLRDCFKFSPDGKFIAYWQFDTSDVNEFALVDYTEELYPKITKFQYPKVGQKNSACRAGVVSIKGGRTAWADIPGDPRDNYIPRMDWVKDSNQLLIQRLNRLQNESKLMLTKVSRGMLGRVRLTKPRTILTETDDAWVDIHNDLKWVDGGRYFTWTSERDGWRHIYLVTTETGKAELLTPGRYDVISFLCVDEEDRWLYFYASCDDAAQRYLYRCSLDAKHLPERISPAGQKGSHSYHISKDCKWAIHTYSSFTSPPVIDLVTLRGHESVKVLADNSELREKLEALSLPEKSFFKVDIGDGVQLDGWCIRPPDFDEEKKYPLLVHVYGEPAGQTVRDSWGGNTMLWHMMLAQQGYVVASVDNRGTPAPKGRQWRKCVYQQIGILASADQAAAVKQLLIDWPYIDPERVGVWGWSGGGSMTLNAMFRYPEIYKTGIAIAFISNQRFYDTIYQERYMSLPEINEEGFTNGSPITFADQLEGNLLIVHGTGDDNCHIQNAYVLIDELIRLDKRFSMLLYPNRTHSISEGDNTKAHLFGTMTDYLNENLPARIKSCK